MACSHKTISSLALFLSLNLLFFSLVTARGSVLQPVPEPTAIVDGNDIISFPNPNSGGSPSSGEPTCPRDSVQLNLCVGLLDLIDITLGDPPTACCNLIAGLVDLEAAVCLCTAIRARALGIIDINLNLNLSLLLNSCNRDVPASFVCA
ncbi:putative lipid-binding protein AIR1 [Momordica charantia]|uniref:Lipid-binding protein AIR1 n=1 Tax=Momordica charantia TaxID=3673 RepID=A0A6J1DMI7_MOMCH|nr:putative lipid-binding protein AIR1 [Momordica charantia]